MEGQNEGEVESLATVFLGEILITIVTEHFQIETVDISSAEFFASPGDALKKAEIHGRVRVIDESANPAFLSAGAARPALPAPIGVMPGATCY